MENQRVRLTKRLVREALLDLLDVCSLGQITVSRLCKHAQISRSTFYVHYGSEVDVLREIEKELIDGIRGSIDEARGSQAWGIGRQVEQMCIYLRGQERVARHVFRENAGGSEFANELLRMRIESQPERYGWLSRCGEQERDACLTFLCAGGFAVLRSWVLGEWQLSPKEVGRIVERNFK